MSEELTEKWAIITSENCKEINAMVSGYKKKIERLQEQLNEANEVINDDLREANSCFAVGRIRKYKEKWGVK